MISVGVGNPNYLDLIIKHDLYDSNYHNPLQKLCRNVDFKKSKNLKETDSETCR